jgi:hypothetical protein
MKLLQSAKFAAGAGGHDEPTKWADKYGSPHSSAPVVMPAIIELDGIQFQSAVPKTAAEAAKINERVKQWSAVAQ